MDSNKLSLKKSSHQLKILTSPELLPLVDRHKLLRSDVFINRVTELTDHFQKHGDYTELLTLIDMFSGLLDQRLLITWICERSGAIYTQNNGKTKLRLRPEKEPKPILFSTWLKMYSTQIFALDTSCIQITKSKEKPNSGAFKKDIDALDSWARLPWSHGRY